MNNSDQFEWQEVQVHWCMARRWVVRGVYSFDEHGIPYSDVLDDLDTQKEAIERASSLPLTQATTSHSAAWRSRCLPNEGTSSTSTMLTDTKLFKESQ